MVIEGLDHEIAAAVEIGVGLAGCAGRHTGEGSAVSFDFRVAPAAGTGVVRPVSTIGRGIRWAIKFVGPDELPGLRVGGAGVDEYRSRGKQKQGRKKSGQSAEVHGQFIS